MHGTKPTLLIKDTIGNVNPQRELRDKPEKNFEPAEFWLIDEVKEIKDGVAIVAARFAGLKKLELGFKASQDTDHFGTRIFEGLSQRLNWLVLVSQ